MADQKFQGKIKSVWITYTDQDTGEEKTEEALIVIPVEQVEGLEERLTDITSNTSAKLDWKSFASLSNK